MPVARKFFSCVVFYAACLDLGCASAKISNETRCAGAPGSPAAMYVGDFDLGAATVRSDPGTLTGRPRLLRLRPQDPARELEDLANLLADKIVADLAKDGIAARRLTPAEPRPSHGWLVTGEFLEVQEGNRLQKAVIGFGAGNSDAKLYVKVADLALPAGEDLLDFNVDSAGNKAPGGAAALVTHSPWGMAGKFVLDRNASEKDIQRAAKQIAERLEKLAKGT